MSYTYSDQAHTKVSSAFVSKDGGLTEAEVQSIIRGTQFCLPNANMVKNITVMVDGSATPSQVFYYPETDHYFEFVKFDKMVDFENGVITEDDLNTSKDYNTTWFDCYNRAKEMTYLGRKGYLASITSADEDLFLSRVCNAVAWTGGTRIAQGPADGTLHYDFSSVTEYDIEHPSASDYWYWADLPCAFSAAMTP